MKSIPESTNFSTRPDDPFSEEIFDALLGKLIENLSKSISLEFSNGNQDEFLFYMPKLTHLDLTQKTEMARDLSQLLFNTRTNRNSMDLRSSLESIKNFQDIENSQEDLLQKLFEKSEIQLTKNDAQNLVRLIFLQCNDSESWVFKADLNEIQDQYVFISKELKKISNKMKKVREKMQEEIDTQDVLQKEFELLQGQGKMMEKQIEEYLIEEFIIDEQTQQLKLEIEEAKNIMKDLGIKEDD
jgi:hypothetical protein